MGRGEIDSALRLAQEAVESESKLWSYSPSPEGHIEGQMERFLE